MINKTLLLFLSILAFIIYFPIKNILLSVGIIFVFALCLKNISKGLNLSYITAFILTGFLISPYTTNLISINDITKLKTIDLIALSIIAISAGLELKINFLKKHIKNLIIITLSQIFIIAIFSFFCFYLIGTFYQNIVFTDINSLIFPCLIATATSPAVTIAVIQETKTSSELSATTLGICILKDFLVIIIISVAIAFLSQNNNSGFDFFHFVNFHFILPIIIAISAGIIYSLYNKFINFSNTLFLIIIIFTTNIFLQKYKIDILNTFIIFRFLISNFTKSDKILHNSIEEITPVFFIIFFTIAAAGLPISLIKFYFIPFVIYSIVKLVLTYISNYIPCIILYKDEKKYKKYLWLGFISQGGVTLGLVNLIENAFPLWGTSFKAIIICYIGIFLIFGPLMFKYGLKKSEDY